MAKVPVAVTMAMAQDAETTNRVWMAERETFNGHTVFSLSDVAMSIHKVIERTYNRQYYVKAEILKLNYYPYSGHCYPELVEREDNKIKAEMRAIIWASKYNDINERFLKITGEPLKENLSILCLATIQFSPKHGLALHIEDVEPSFTLGEMERNRKEVVERLKKEGVFEQNRKLDFPLLPKRLAVISVETSKGYSDFINTLRTNKAGYSFHTELFPSILQGEKAISGMTFQLGEIKKRIDDFDVVVIVRGGGGDVGLSCYDDYSLSRAIATFPLPVLTGIGHSTNVSVCDMVAFKSFITPTEVAFSLLQRFEDFDLEVDSCVSSIVNSARLHVANAKSSLQMVGSDIRIRASKLTDESDKELSEISKTLLFRCRELVLNHKNEHKLLSKTISSSALKHIRVQSQALPAVASSLVRGSVSFLKHKHEECSHVEEKLTLLSPDNVLKRGYSITMLNGKAVTTAGSLSPGDRIVTKVYSGEVTSVVEDVKR